jgi:hypothetical protein
VPASGPAIVLAGSSIAEGASVGDLVGLLSVANSPLDFDFTLTDDADGQFVLDGNRLEVADTLTPGDHTITVEATAGDVELVKSFSITVASATAGIPLLVTRGFYVSGANIASVVRAGFGSA